MSGLSGVRGAEGGEMRDVMALSDWSSRLAGGFLVESGVRGISTLRLESMSLSLLTTLAGEGLEGS